MLVSRLSSTFQLLLLIKLLLAVHAFVPAHRPDAATRKLSALSILPPRIPSEVSPLVVQPVVEVEQKTEDRIKVEDATTLIEAITHPSVDLEQFLGGITLEEQTGQISIPAINNAVPKEYSLRHKLGLDMSYNYNDDDNNKNNNDGENKENSAIRLVSNILGNRPSIVGHRGALYDTLENTRAGFLRCANEYQCDAVELDVFVLPKDGTLIVFHGGGTDENPGDLLEYCIDPPASSILDLTYEEALNLKFNPQHAEFPCPVDQITNPTVAYIPTLEEVLLDLKDTNCKVKIELKGPGTVQPVLDLVERLNVESMCSYSSFDLQRLAELREIKPDKQLYSTGALFANELSTMDYMTAAQNVGATEIHLPYDACSRQVIQQLQSFGFRTMAWLRGPPGMANDVQTKYLDVGNEDISCYQALVETGVDQICCNKPGLLAMMLQTKTTNTANIRESMLGTILQQKPSFLKTI